MKIIDGNGVTVFHHTGYSSSPLKTSLLVNYGSGNNVKVQIYFYNNWSQFKLKYGIVNQDLQSGGLLCLHQISWTTRISNKNHFILLAFTWLPLGFKTSILGGFLVCRLFPIPELSPFSSINVYFVVVLITIPFNNYYGFL